VQPGTPAKAKLFFHGRSQAVRLPKEFRFEGSEVFVRRVGEDVVLSTRAKPSMRVLVEAVEEFEGDMSSFERAQPRQAERRESFDGKRSS
jgi:antitoxin VapB